MGITSLRRHLYPNHYSKPTTISDIMGEEMHSSGLTMREYNEIAKEVSKMSDKDILNSVDDINKATTISVLESINGDVRRWEEESPAYVEDKNAAQENKDKKEENVLEGFNDLVENVPIVVSSVEGSVKKKRTKKKITLE